jgi:hypothetical protein
MENQEDILGELKRLHQKVDAMAGTLAELLKAKSHTHTVRKSKPKPPPLTQEETDRLQKRFEELYQRWLANQEAAVSEELEAMSPEDLRRFADANNLNVTAKTSKERVIRLIGFRFREKKQLAHPVVRTSAGPA